MSSLNFAFTLTSSCLRMREKPRFSLSVPGVKSIALNTTDAKRVKENLEMADIEIPVEFWDALQSKGLIEVNFFKNLQPVFQDKKEINNKNIS